MILFLSLKEVYIMIPEEHKAAEPRQGMIKLFRIMKVLK